MNHSNAPRQPALPTLATITIHNLRLRTFIGFNPEEPEKQQALQYTSEQAGQPHFQPHPLRLLEKAS